MTDESVLVLEPGDERAKKIGKAMASTTASDVLSALSEKEYTLSELSEHLGQPITTLKYQVENLLDADLIEIVRTRYSEKGRVVKVYGARRQVVIMTPARGADLRSVLLKYASLFALIICATLVLLAMAPTFDFMQPVGSVQSVQSGGDLMTGAGAGPADDAVAEDLQTVAFSAEEADASGTTAEEGDNVAKAGATRLAAPAEVPAPAPAPVEAVFGTSGLPPNILAVTFFTGGFVVIFLMLLFELVAMYRRQ